MGIYFKGRLLFRIIDLYGGQMNIFNNLILFIIAFDIVVAFVVYKAIDIYKNK